MVRGHTTCNDLVLTPLGLSEITNNQITSQKDFSMEKGKPRLTPLFAHTRAVTKHSLIIPRVELNVYKSSIAYRGPTLWNNLPTELKSSHTINMFKHSFKSLLKDNNLELL